MIHVVTTDEKLDMTQQAEGAILNGNKVEKVNAEELDTHPNGTIGTVIGSFAIPPEALVEAPPILKNVKFGYFVTWDNSSIKQPVFCVDFKIKEVS